MLKPEFFTFENFMKAHTQVITRCFGTPTEIMMVPFADCANHHVTDNEFHVLNVRLNEKHIEAEEKKVEPDVTNEEMKYFTKERNRIKVKKNFEEDANTDYDKIDMPYKSLRYAKKLKLRHDIEQMTIKQFKKDPEF